MHLDGHDRYLRIYSLHNLARGRVGESWEHAQILNKKISLVNYKSAKYDCDRANSYDDYMLNYGIKKKIIIIDKKKSEELKNVSREERTNTCSNWKKKQFRS